MYKLFLGLVLQLLMVLVPLPSLAQQFPVRPIRLVVPFAAGGPTDLLARTVASRWSDELGQPVVVENRAGAAGSLAAEYTARAAADGYTVMMVTSGTQAINAALYPKLNYDPLRDFSYVSPIGVYSLVMVANPKLEVRDVSELIRLARSRPNALSYGSAGNGTSGHLAAELFKSASGIQVQHIAYKGSAPSMVGVMSGDLAFVFDLVSTALPLIQSGKVRAMAWSGKQRSTLLPEVPTFAEAGLPNFEVAGWIGIAAPAGLDKDVLGRLHGSLARALQADKVRESLVRQGYELNVLSPESFTSMVRSDIGMWGTVVRNAGVKAD